MLADNGKVTTINIVLNLTFKYTVHIPFLYKNIFSLFCYVFEKFVCQVSNIPVSKVIVKPAISCSMVCSVSALQNEFPVFHQP